MPESVRHLLEPKQLSFGHDDVAAITSGPFAGDIAAVVNQPSTFLRLALP